VSAFRRGPHTHTMQDMMEDMTEDVCALNRGAFPWAGPVPRRTRTQAPRRAPRTRRYGPLARQAKGLRAMFSD
jgi:hypothetical protein